ncbi:hypothetical protein SLE2022_390810 [Rubroshorea leprosula]
MGDSRTHLDRALFQLTPTRTRFDLVLFYKGKNEKLASGLFEPFISHLKVARDEISVGGYSISLQPPVPNAHWFTKATFERFVRFVSTPAVLERFVSLEREILQIEKSVLANEVSETNLGGRQEEVHGSSDSSKLKGELDRKDETLPEENSKTQLHQLLETRKTLLRKEQAMAYARGLVAGFAMENMDDLISFAEAFGASRLREACFNFIELCKKKHADHLWMEELAAVKACSSAEFSLLGTSGIVLANEISNPNPVSNESLEASKSHLINQTATLDPNKVVNLSASDHQTPSTATKYQMPIQWPNQMPQYMYNFPGLVQQLPSYQGYPFHPMQPVPLPYPRNTHQSLNRNQTSSLGKNEKLPNGKEDEYSGEDGQTESSASDSGSDSHMVRRNMVQQDRNHPSADHSSRRKHRKKSSKTIVIRNINYITPKRRDGEKGQVSDGSSLHEDDFNDKVSFGEKIEDAVSSMDECCNLNSGDEKGIGADRGHYSTNGSHKQNFSDDLEVGISKGGNIGDNWEVFQKVLMKNGNASVKGVETNASTPAIELESEKVVKQQMVSADSFVVKERNENKESRVKLELDDFVNEESFHPLMKSNNCMDEVFLNPRRLEKSGNELGDILSPCVEESSIIKSGKEEDWFIVNHSGKPEHQDSTNGQTIFDGDQVLPFKGDNSYHQMSKDIVTDDSFMVHARPELDGQYDSQWKTEISMIADLTSASKPENGSADDSQDKNKVLGSHEPDDLYMVLQRDAGFESTRDSMTLDYGIDISMTEGNGRNTDVEGREYAEKKLPLDGQKTIVKNSDNCRTKKPVKEARSKLLHGSLVKSRAETMTRSEKPSSLVNRTRVQKSKLEKEEEIRKKMEEILIQRQKRIAERTVAGGHASAVSNKAISESNTTKNSVKPDKNKNLSTARATDRASAVKLRAS